MDAINKLLDDFVKVRKEFIRTIDKFPENKRSWILFGKWSLKDILAHLSGWDKLTVESIEIFRKGEIPKWGLGVYDFNKKSVNERKRWSWKKIYKEFVDLQEEIINAYKSIPKEKYNQKIWTNRNETPLDFLRIDINHYKKEHLPEIKRELRLCD
jgi:hypothetical protein